MNATIKTALYLPLAVALVLAFISWSFYGELFISFLPYGMIVYIVYMLIVSGVLFISRIDTKRLNTYWFNWLLAFFLFLGIYTFYADFRVNADTDSGNLKFVTVNLWYQNTHYPEIQEFLEEEDADVLMVTEFTYDQYQYLENYLITTYPFRTVQLDDLTVPYTGKAVFSKYPLSGEKFDNDEFGELFLTTGLTYADREIDLTMVHTTAPVNTRFFAARNSQLDHLGSSLVKNLNQDALVSGDFNLSPWSPRFIQLSRRLGEQGLGVVNNSGFDFSWTYEPKPLFKSHIDHTFVSEGLTIEDYHLKTFPGSDHKAQIYYLSAD